MKNFIPIRNVFDILQIMSGLVIAWDGLYWLFNNYAPFGSDSLRIILTGIGPKPSYYYLVGFPLAPGIVLPVYPISILALGVFMVFLALRYHALAAPLWLMACGAFDVLYDPGMLWRLFGGDFWVVFQITIMLLGWALAGFPRFKVNKWAGLLLVVFILTSGGLTPYPFEFALFAYIVTSTEPNLWGKKLTIKEAMTLG